MRRVHREIVDGWLFWSVFELARRRPSNTDLQVRAAQLARIEALELMYTWRL